MGRKVCDAGGVAGDARPTSLNLDFPGVTLGWLDDECGVKSHQPALTSSGGALLSHAWMSAGEGSMSAGNLRLALTAGGASICGVELRVKPKMMLDWDWLLVWVDERVERAGLTSENLDSENLDSENLDSENLDSDKGEKVSGKVSGASLSLSMGWECALNEGETAMMWGCGFRRGRCSERRRPRALAAAAAAAAAAAIRASTTCMEHKTCGRGQSSKC